MLIIAGMDRTTSHLHQWMQLAIEQARESGVDIPVGCVIIHEGEIVGRGYNLREKTLDPTAHAEIVAIRQAAETLGRWRLSACTLVTTLEPCAMCAEAIIQARVEELVFGAYDLKSGACGSRFNLFTPDRIYPIPNVIGGIDEEICKGLIEEYFKKSVRNSKNGQQ